MINDVIWILLKVNHGIDTNKWIDNQKRNIKRLEMLKTMISFKNMFCEERGIQDIKIDFYLIKRYIRESSFLCNPIDII